MIERARGACDREFVCQLGMLLVAIVAVTLPSAQTRAEPPRPDAAFHFDIPSQQLDVALDVFSSASGYQVLYETALTADRRSTAVSGSFTEEAALRLLLKGTGLDFAYTAERAFTLVRVEERSRSAAEFYPFLGRVQSRIMAALCLKSETRPGAFRVALQLWIGPRGRIERPILLSSTGQADRDVAIADALIDLALETSPPAGMPQPVTMVLRPGPPERADECGRGR